MKKTILIALPLACLLLVGAVINPGGGNSGSITNITSVVPITNRGAIVGIRTATSAQSGAISTTDYATFLGMQRGNASLSNIAGLTFAEGDLLVYSNSVLTKIPKGTEGQVLKYNAGGYPVPGTDNTGGSGVTNNQVLTNAVLQGDTAASNITTAELSIDGISPGLAYFTNASGTNLTSLGFGSAGQIPFSTGTSVAWSNATTKVDITNTVNVGISNAFHRMETVSTAEADTVLLVDMDVPNTWVNVGHTGLVLSNYAGLKPGTSKSKVIYLKPGGTNTETFTIAYPIGGAGGTNGCFWRTNSYPLGNAPFTTITNVNTNNVYVLTVQSAGTNLFPAMTEWR